jgi:hypothetical protein
MGHSPVSSGGRSAERGQIRNGPRDSEGAGHPPHGFGEFRVDAREGTGVKIHLRYVKIIPSLFIVKVSPSMVPVVVPAPSHVKVSVGPCRV